MKIITLSAAFILTCICTQSQNLVGYKGNDILKFMKENRRDMNYNNVVNSKFSYLKYSDNSEDQTMLFFLNPDSICRSMRIICDIGMKSQKVKELDSKYLKNGENNWLDRHDGKEYIIELMEGKWSCVISIETKK
jgi:hypothetical protein